MLQLLLIGPDGTVEKVYRSDRFWGRIEWNGRWYRSRHQADPSQPHVYQRDT